MTSIFSASRRITALLGLRALALLGGSALFGLGAAAGFPPWSFPSALFLGFLYGTAFLTGTGYRILIALAQRSQVDAPASWSGASAGVALLTAGLSLMAREPAAVLAASGLAITLAYLAVKAGCCLSDCCQQPLTLFGRKTGLREFEIAAGFLFGIAGGLALLVSPALAAVTMIGGHLGLRLFSRRKRGRSGSGWPPLRQPGAEIAPLALCLALALWQLLA